MAHERDQFMTKACLDWHV